MGEDWDDIPDASPGGTDSRGTSGDPGSQRATSNSASPVGPPIFPSETLLVSRSPPSYIGPTLVLVQEIFS